MLSPVSGLLFGVTQLSVSGLQVLLSLFGLDRVPNLIRFAGPYDTFMLSLTATSITALTNWRVNAISYRVCHRPFSHLVTFFIRHRGRLLVQVILHGPLLYMNRAYVKNRLTPIT